MSGETDITSCGPLLAELGRRFGMGPLALGADRSCTLRFSDQLEVCLALNGDGGELALFAVVGAWPDSGAPASAQDHSRWYGLAVKVLAANFLWQQTAGATLALAPQRQLTLMRRLALPGLAARVLEQALHLFVDVALAWQKRLAAFAFK